MQQKIKYNYKVHSKKHWANIPQLSAQRKMNAEND